MSVPVIAFFNNKGGVGKTTLVYHLAWMFADLGVRVLAADLDPQSNLTAAFLEEDDLTDLWTNFEEVTIFGCVLPLIRGVGDIGDPKPQRCGPNLGLLAGNLQLSSFEDELATQWPACLDGSERAFRVESALWRIVQKAALARRADLVLMDLGPNLGSINRSALLGADYVVIPLSPDLFSLQGLRNLGSTFAKWRRDWQDRLQRRPDTDLDLPQGKLQPLGYIVFQQGARRRSGD